MTTSRPAEPFNDKGWRIVLWDMDSKGRWFLVQMVGWLHLEEIKRLTDWYVNEAIPWLEEQETSDDD